MNLKKKQKNKIKIIYAITAIILALAITALIVCVTNNTPDKVAKTNMNMKTLTPKTTPTKKPLSEEKMTLSIALNMLSNAEGIPHNINEIKSYGQFDLNELTSSDNPPNEITILESLSNTKDPFFYKGSKGEIFEYYNIDKLWTVLPWLGEIKGTKRQKTVYAGDYIYYKVDNRWIRKSRPKKKQ